MPQEIGLKSQASQIGGRAQNRTGGIYSRSAGPIADRVSITRTRNYPACTPYLISGMLSMERACLDLKPEASSRAETQRLLSSKTKWTIQFESYTISCFNKKMCACAYLYLSDYTHTYLYIYTYLCICTHVEHASFLRVM